MFVRVFNSIHIRLNHLMSRFSSNRRLKRIQIRSENENKRVEELVKVIIDQNKRLDNHAATVKEIYKKLDILQDKITFEFAESERELSFITKSLYARSIFERYEQKLKLDLKQTYVNQHKSMCRETLWKIFINTKGYKFQNLRNNITFLGLQHKDVPNIASTLYSRLCVGVHDSYTPNSREVLIDESLLQEKEVKLLEAVCMSYPLGKNGYRIIAS